MPALQIGWPVENEGAMAWSITGAGGIEIKGIATDQLRRRSDGLWSLPFPVSRNSSGAWGRSDPQPTVPSSAVIFTSTECRPDGCPFGPSKNLNRPTVG